MLSHLKINECLFSFNNEYTYTMQSFENNSDNTEVSIDERFSTGLYGYFEKQVLKTLYTFHYLNRCNIERFIGIYANRQVNVKQILSSLTKDGLIRKHCFSYEDAYVDAEREAGTWKNIVAYELTKSGYHYCAIRQWGYKTYNYHEPEEIGHIQEIILENLSIAQWHIGVLDNHKVALHRFMLKDGYGETVLKIPSFIVMKEEKLIRNLSLIAIPLPKNLNEGTVKKVIGKLMRIRGYLYENNIKFSIIVFVADSLKNIHSFMSIIIKIESLNKMPICCCVDSNTKEGKDPLKHIYKVSTQDNKQILSKLNFDIN